MFIKPAPGLTVRDPESGRPLLAGGEDKPATSYWLRRLADGDVVDPGCLCKWDLPNPFDPGCPEHGLGT